jgi:MYXO-CTERM domain-containing protein
MRSTSLIVAGLSFFVGSSALAHVKITSHTMRNSAAFIKRAPCGESPDSRSENVHTFLSGSTITLTWDEFIPHPGHYRIAFDEDGDDFPEPAAYDDFFPATEPGTTIMEDNLFPHTSLADPIYSFDVTFPDIECDNCTLQLIQMMTDKPPYTVGGNDIYYNCLDIVLTRDEAQIPLPPAPFEFAGGACAVEGSSSSTPILFLALSGLVVFGVVRRRARVIL